MAAEIPREVAQSGTKILAAGTQGYNRDANAGIAKGVNAASDMLVKTAEELVGLPFRTIIAPAGRFLLGSTVTVAKSAVVYTAKALKNLPLIPVPTNNNAA